MTQPLLLHSDDGSPMKGATMLGTLRRLGVTSSFSCWYNTEHKHSGLSSPRRSNVTRVRQRPYWNAGCRSTATPGHVTPNAGVGETRDWELREQVWLNLEKEQPELNQAA